jgi:hypothetical protein
MSLNMNPKSPVTEIYRQSNLKNFIEKSKVSLPDIEPVVNTGNTSNTDILMKKYTTKSFEKEENFNFVEEIKINELQPASTMNQNKIIKRQLSTQLSLDDKNKSNSHTHFKKSSITTKEEQDKIKTRRNKSKYAVLDETIDPEDETKLKNLLKEFTKTNNFNEIKKDSRLSIMHFSKIYIYISLQKIKELMIQY